MRLILPIRLAQTETTRVLGSFFFSSLIPKFRAVAVIFFLSAIPFWTRATDFAERRGAARSLARKGRGVWERMSKNE